MKILLFLLGAVLGSLLMPLLLDRFIVLTREPVRGDGGMETESEMVLP